MMRIAYLSTQVAYYGAEVHLRQLATGMLERSHDVACVVRPGCALQAELHRSGIPMLVLPLVDWFDVASIKRLGCWLNRRGVQILHTHNPRDYYIAAVASLGTEASNIGTRHLIHRISAPVFKRPFLRRFPAMIAISEAVRTGLLASRVLDPERIILVHNGIDLDRALPQRDGLRRRVGLDDGAPVIGFVGRLCPEKGLQTLLAAARLLVNAGHTQLKVFIVGDDTTGGDYAGLLQQRVAALDLKGAVHFFGYVPDAARASADFDVQVVCSDAEPFGLVTLEGMAHRHPVIATASGGSGEIIRDGVDGYLVQPRNPQALAARLSQLLRRPHLRAQMGHRARRRVEESFSLTRMLERTEAIYRDVLAGRCGLGGR